MVVAYISPEGRITDLAVKPSPFRVLAAGERVLVYSPPSHDPEFDTATPVEPVPAEAAEVAFELVPVAGATERRKTKLLAKIDSDVDHIYSLAIGNRGTEYAQAELEADYFRASGYTLDPVPDYVASWASASNITAQAAAESILSQAVLWRTAAAAIRTQRLAAKAAVRQGNLNLASWDYFVQQITASLGV